VRRLKINAVKEHTKLFTQNSDANSEKHSEIERFATLNERTITFWLQHHSFSYFNLLS